jgi:hypothetical protein
MYSESEMTISNNNLKKGIDQSCSRLLPNFGALGAGADPVGGACAEPTNGERKRRWVSACMISCRQAHDGQHKMGVNTHEAKGGVKYTCGCQDSK